MSIRNRLNRFVKKQKARLEAQAKRRAGVYMHERPKTRYGKRRRHDGTMG